MNYRSSNPTLSNGAFARARAYTGGDTMTVQGTVNKSFFLLLLLVISASWVWQKVIQPTPLLGYEDAAAKTMASVQPLMLLGLIGGGIVGLVTCFKMNWARILAPLYALLEGLFIGGISAIFELSYPGIVMQAVGLTFGTLFCLLAAYKTGLVTVTQKFRLGVMAATGGVFFFYLASWIMSMFGMANPLIHGTSMFSIGFSLVVVGIAALNLVLDFDLIDRLSQQGAPRHLEWYGAFALMVTLVWLYLEILRLLSKLNSRR